LQPVQLLLFASSFLSFLAAAHLCWEVQNCSKARQQIGSTVLHRLGSRRGGRGERQGWAMGSSETATVVASGGRNGGGALPSSGLKARRCWVLLSSKHKGLQ
jgi:hypothetical protein